jgi:hypothetical protein
MADEESPEPKTRYAERIPRRRASRSLKVLPSAAKDEWPANLGELLEWHADEVEEVMRAAQLRLQDSTKIIRDYRRGEIDFGEAAERVDAHETRWGETFPAGITGNTRGKSDDEIRKLLDDFRNRGNSEGRG